MNKDHLSFLHPVSVLNHFLFSHCFLRGHFKWFQQSFYFLWSLLFYILIHFLSENRGFTHHSGLAWVHFPFTLPRLPFRLLSSIYELLLFLYFRSFNCIWKFPLFVSVIIFNVSSRFRISTYFTSLNNLSGTFSSLFWPVLGFILHSIFLQIFFLPNMVN